MSKLIGVQKITSKKSGESFMKLYFTEPVPLNGGVGDVGFTEFVSFNSDYFDLVGRDIQIVYKKGFNGQAIVDHIEAF